METNFSLSIYWSKEDESFIALCPEFPGISAFGDTYKEVIEDAEAVLTSTVDLCKKNGRELPEPKLLPEHSGQFRIRIPKYLHTSLVLEAERQGVSLNTLVQIYLAQSVTQAAAENYFSQMRQHLSEICEGIFSSWYKAKISYETLREKIHTTAIVDATSWPSTIDVNSHGGMKCLNQN